MKHLRLNIGLAAIVLFAAACQTNTTNNTETTTETVKAVKPMIVTEPVVYDTDDPAIWVNPEDASKSLIVGTDKNEDGALFVFDLEGKIVQDKVVRGLKRPNNVDIAYGLKIGGKSVDIALTGERMTHNMRLFSLPDMQPLDGGGIPVFEGETGVEYRDLMGVALYKRPSDGAIFAIMGRKTGPTDGTYLWQYLLEDNGQSGVKATLVRKFGMFSGNKEIEAIAVDDELGYIYYSDEGVGVRKYYADPEKGNEELALFATEGFTDDHEGISIFDTGNGKGFILVSDQQASQFKIYPREGSATNPHDHTLIESVLVSTVESDGSEISNVAFNDTFKRGIFVAMSDDKTFQYYRVEDILPLD
ncbi:phytase [Roseivirga pacifica]|uniref:phytase n=1 Tax=Roseivirga pacifica TaxID=1267423 RepID=UPI002094CCC8|nr:phytase [Roseivirga pacifica]MCO6360337.1 phytase [Roseivirga pacifica]MCO6368226.1 phytase [Roseivirga pacifica]MCO6372368.1 phytase [Roseivirga pacifica]MCO6376426.1 phytase [Roseivirga pacifica]MCO6378294.1 phytase [Roseivirga pacifica]